MKKRFISLVLAFGVIIMSSPSAFAMPFDVNYSTVYEKESNDTKETAQQICAPTKVYGGFTSEDSVDFYRLDLAGHWEFTFSPSKNFSPEISCTFFLYDEDGNCIDRTQHVPKTGHSGTAYYRGMGLYSDKIKTYYIKIQKDTNSEGEYSFSAWDYSGSDTPYVTRITSETKSRETNAMLDSINSERKKANLSPVSINATLNQAAAVRAEELSHLFSHDRPNGSSNGSVLEDLGIVSSGYMENIYFSGGFYQASDAMKALMNSESHKKNILSKDWNQVGLALYVADDFGPDPDGKNRYSDRYYWVQFFAKGVSVEQEPYPGTPFTDISKHWARDSAKWVYEQGLFSGINDTKFGPEDKMERGMLATVLYRLSGKPEVSGNNTFSDVDSSAYYANPVTWAYQNRIVSGVGDEKFQPKGKITREQFASMLYRYANTPAANGDLNNFSDTESISDYARSAMCWAVGGGIISGKGGGKLDPKGSATRAEVAAMLQRFVK